MKEFDNLKSQLMQVVTILAEIEQNKELINQVGAHVTDTINSAMGFLQGNLDSILSTIILSITSSIGTGFLGWCDVLTEARAKLISGGFTPEQAFDILKGQGFYSTLVDKLKDNISAKAH